MERHEIDFVVEATGFAEGHGLGSEGTYISSWIRRLQA